jgi:hypothetical protein
LPSPERDISFCAATSALLHEQPDPVTFVTFAYQPRPISRRAIVSATSDAG